MNDRERYAAAMHGVQSGVAHELAREGPDSGECSPKHLRVGVNSALLNDAAIATLLIAKGIFTEEEYVKAVADEAEKEKARYEARVSAALGRPVKLA